MNVAVHSPTHGVYFDEAFETPPLDEVRRD